MFYAISVIKSNPTMSFVVGCLLLVASFNVVDAYQGGRLFVVSASSSNSDLIESYGKGSAGRQVIARSELAYDIPENGKGGPEEYVFVDENLYPTTADDALMSDFTPLTIDQNQVTRDQIVYYTVQDGDTVSEIADKFG
ncbi:MAG: LysM domain-containing protein, partial [Patescibacteria group bacterium]